MDIYLFVGEKINICFSCFHIWFFRNNMLCLLTSDLQSIYLCFCSPQCPKFFAHQLLSSFSWKRYLRVGCIWFFVVQDHSKPNLPLKRCTEKGGGTLEFYILICEQEFFRKQESYFFFWERFLYPVNQEGEFQRASSYLYVITYSVQFSEMCIICIKKEKGLLLTAPISMKSWRGGFKFILFFYDGYEFSHNFVKSPIWFPAKLMLLSLIVTVDGRYWRGPKQESTEQRGGLGERGSREIYQKRHL